MGRTTTAAGSSNDERRFGALLGVLLAALAVAGCGPGAGDAGGAGGGGDGGPVTVALVVTEERWNGWDPGHRPRPREVVLEGGVGGSLELRSGLRLEVVGIGADGVELRASEEVALVSTTGGIDLADPTDQLTVPAQGELRFATATTDAGWCYVVARR